MNKNDDIMDAKQEGIANPGTPSVEAPDSSFINQSYIDTLLFYAFEAFHNSDFIASHNKVLHEKGFITAKPT